MKDLSVVEESRAVSRMIEMSRKYGSNPEGMKKLLVNAHALCLYSSTCLNVAHNIFYFNNA
jgi:hypothetical protein